MKNCVIFWNIEDIVLLLVIVEDILVRIGFLVFMVLEKLVYFFDLIFWKYIKLY